MISAVIPAYNEEAAIAQVVREVGAALSQTGAAWEIVVVDDGSDDRTFERVLALGDELGNVRAIKLSRNFGKESALLAGLAAARGDAVITIDADLQHPPGLIPDLVARWRDGFKVVHAVKRNRLHDGLFARWRAAAFNRLFSSLGGIDLRNASDFKLLDRVAVDVIVTQLNERQRFYRGLTDWVGFRQTSVEFDVGRRHSGTGTWSLGSLANLASTGIVAFSTAPLRIVSFLGVVTLLFAIVLATQTLYSWVVGTSVSGFPSTMITLLLLGSLIMISLGILGEYVGKIYDEVKGRPGYVVDETPGTNDRDAVEKEDPPR